ncbi:MAG TPA: Spy/CpxP family protein refolding chaperone [Bryobacteraceae bacterium]|nr:Spy/CpxP family protein refolding chaperone [Bryobacteraceae bacterium]
MKRSLTKFLLISAFAASSVFAQNAGPNPANMAQRRVKFLTTLLTLTTAQQQQATTIFTNAATANQTTAASVKTARQSLQTAIQGNDAGSLSQIANTIGTLTAQTTLANAQADMAFYQILTPAQQTQYTQYQTQGRGRFGPAFRGGR